MCPVPGSSVLPSRDVTYDWSSSLGGIVDVSDVAISVILPGLGVWPVVPVLLAVDGVGGGVGGPTGM